ncbi:VOC family protein [Bradyrhizobium sp. CB3481]|uniref:VOC family protein n=1 Tax=Bradyrhizobium sp. CB3481 TaxID=3039158 RepID=UPI0024B0FDFF|nr:VOC family protein [Bradyrhizobium sp. CB3481]WFU15191.1 VOC family protein [Bradyrhizobium sp. CB3481]
MEGCRSLPHQFDTDRPRPCNRFSCAKPQQQCFAARRCRRLRSARNPENPMPRRLDHLVVCVRDLTQAALDWQTLGFTLTPTGVHPFGTSNRLAQFGNNFLELLAVTDAAAVPPAAPDRFSFAAHNQDFLRTREGMSMLALHSDDAHADAARFKAEHVSSYAPFDFGRDAVLPGGGTARVEFSLAFAAATAMPGIAFFTCQQRHPPELFWKSDYQCHPNGALRVVEVVMSAPEPAAHRDFLERVTESKAELAPGRLTVGASGDRISVLDARETARRLPGCAIDTAPRFCAARVVVTDLDATRLGLKDNGVDFEMIGAVLLVSSAATHGLALEFVERKAV